MAVTSTPIFPQAINLGIGTIANADGTAVKTVFTAGANGSKVEAITVSSTDTSNRDLLVYVTRGGTNYLLCTVNILANSGNANNVAPVDVFRASMVPGLSYDAFGNRCLYLKSGDTLTVSAGTTVTSAKTITIVAQGGDF